MTKVSSPVESLVRVHPLGCDFSLEAPERNRAWYEVRGYEPMSTALFRTAATGADAVLDIGAHVGYYSLLGRSASPEAQVVAVEASPENAEALRRNVADADVAVVNAAFGAESGTVWIQVTEASDNCGLTGHPNSPTQGTVEVPAVTGADLAMAGGGRLVVKLDVEGHELAALTGLEPVFARYDDVRLLVEMNPKCLVAAGFEPQELVDRLRGYGLRLFVLDEERRSWAELTADRGWADLIAPTAYANLYAVSADRCRTVSAVLHSGGTGGAERSHAEMTESLVRQGCMVHTVVPEPDLGLRDELWRLGGSVDLVPALGWWTVWPDEERESVASWTSRELVHAPLLAALSAVGADVVLTQSGVVPQGAIAAAALRCPHVWFVREFGDLDHGLVLPGGREQFGDAVKALSEVVVSNSQAVRDHLFGAGEVGIRIIRPAPRLGVLERPVAGGRPWTVGVVGSLNPGKGQEDAVRAVASLRAEGLDVPLVLAGPATEPDLARVRDLALQLGVDDLVQTPGVIADRAALYGALDAVAITSRSEAFGRIPFEAAAAGIPVVYAQAGGLIETLSDGVTGLAYAPGDSDGLALALRSLRESPERVESLVMAARTELLSAGRTARYDAEVVDLVRSAANRAAPSDVLDVIGGLARQAAASEQDNSTLRADLERVLGEHGELIDRFRTTEGAYADLIEGHGGMVAAYDALVANHAQLERDHAVSRENNRVLRGRVGDLEDAAERTRAAAEASWGRRVADLEERLAALTQAHDAVLRSRTWRWGRRARTLVRRR